MPIASSCYKAVSLSLLNVRGNLGTCFSIYIDSEISEFGFKTFSRNVLTFFFSYL
jgi:hypothetical protein